MIPKIADSSNVLALSRIHITSDLDGPALGAKLKSAEVGNTPESGAPMPPA